MKLEQAQQAGIAPWDQQIDEKTTTVVYLDRYPCTPGHRLYVPKDDHANHIARAMEDALADGMHMVTSGECDAFNIGYNGGVAAGQTAVADGSQASRQGAGGRRVAGRRADAADFGFFAG